MLGTTFLETAATMQPIMERASAPIFSKYDAGTPIGRRLGNTIPGDGYRYRGRGFVQLTGRANYAKAAHILNIDCENKPELVLVPTNAAEIMFVGMDQGWFTGKDLNDFIDDKDESDQQDWLEYVGARRIINGTDKAEKIANYAIQFEHALTEAGYPL
jgi:putative chitinase